MEVVSPADFLELIEEFRSSSNARHNLTLRLDTDEYIQLSELAQKIGTNRHRLAIALLNMALKNTENALKMYPWILSEEVVRDSLEG